MAACDTEQSDITNTCTHHQDVAITDLLHHSDKDISLDQGRHHGINVGPDIGSEPAADIGLQSVHIDPCIDPIEGFDIYPTEGDDIASNYEGVDIASNYEGDDIASNYEGDDIVSNYEGVDIASNYEGVDIGPNYEGVDIGPNDVIVPQDVDNGTDEGLGLDICPPETGTIKIDSHSGCGPNEDNQSPAVCKAQKDYPELEKRLLRMIMAAFTSNDTLNRFVPSLTKRQPHYVIELSLKPQPKGQYIYICTLNFEVCRFPRHGEAIGGDIEMLGVRPCVRLSVRPSVTKLVSAMTSDFIHRFTQYLTQ